MANVEHSALTGSALHESKGVATALAGTVYVANGAGSGNWTTITNPFSTALLHVRDQVSSGVASQTITSGSWQRRNLNQALTTEIAGATLSGNQITGLPSGTYWVDGRVAWSLVANNIGSGSPGGISVNRIRLRNMSDSTDLIYGLNESADTTRVSVSGVQVDYNMGGVIPISGRFTIAAPKTIELQHYLTIANGTASGGSASTAAGVNEVYADLMIWKVS